MANFQKHHKNVDGQTLKAPGATTYELGLYAPFFGARDGEELTVSVLPPNPAVTVTKGKMLQGQLLRLYKISNLPTGLTQLVASDHGIQRYCYVTIDTSPSSGTGRIYTDSANEFPTTRTTPSSKDVVTMLVTAWPDLTENGARTLTAQFMAETGRGKYCFNWNLGNVKATASQPHMYLAIVWECASQESADRQVAAAGGLAHIATDDEIKAHGWRCPNVVVVFSPPHAQCRFRAYSSLADGAQRWLGHHKTIAQNHADFLTSLNDGDTAAVAHALKMVGYYTASEADYASAMKRMKDAVDKELGSLP